MNRRKHEKSSVPDFKSREEAAEWFDTHDIADYVDEFEVVEATADQNLTKSLNIRLSTELFNKLQRQAHAKGLGMSTLARMWILERLSENGSDRQGG